MNAICKSALISCLSVLSFSASAENYALIMGISEYQKSPLLGVKKDIKTAISIAKSLNVPARNMTVKKDKELTLQGINQAIKAFEQKIKKGDKAFIYFSGHGSSFTKPGAQDECEKALVTQEMAYLNKNTFHQKLTGIANKAGKTFVMIDACFSGGLAVSSKELERNYGEEMPKSKFFAKSSSDSCATVTNYSSKGLRDFGVESASQTPNYFLLASSSPMEVSIDGGLSYGGFATTTFYNCLQKDQGVDRNGDSVITLEEVQYCAQQDINRKISASREQYSGFRYNAQTLTAGIGPGSNVPIAFTSSSNNTTNRINTMALLETIQKGANANYRVTIKPTQPTYKIGRDYLEMTVTSNKSGYLTIFSVGSSGKIFQLFPNHKDSNNAITAQSTLSLPRAAWRIKANGPAGTDRFLAVISNKPDTFSGLGVSAGPFSMVNNDAQGAKLIITRLIAPVDECKFAERDFSVEDAPECNNSYGAGFMDVKEVN